MRCRRNGFTEQQNRVTQKHRSLGRLYLDGLGVKQDCVAAYNWFQKAALQEDAAGQYFVGMSYQTGQGVDEDHETAAEWFQRAALQGYVDAQYQLGLSYLSGLGYDNDIERAYYWLFIAASSGYEDALKYRKEAAKQLSILQRVRLEKMAKKWLKEHKRESVRRLCGYPSMPLGYFFYES